MQKRLEVGQIVNTFGIKGMVKVKPFTDDITRFDKLDKVSGTATMFSNLLNTKNIESRRVSKTAGEHHIILEDENEINEEEIENDNTEENDEKDAKMASFFYVP